MDVFSNLLYGFSVALTPANLFWCVVGVTLGTIIGILPGLGPSATIAVLLPFTFGLSPASALIMLAGIYYGAKYGGSTTSILLNTPGESASVVTCLDGYELAKQGRAGAALGIAAISSFIAGTIGVILLTLIALPVAQLGLQFGPPEFFALMLLGMTCVVFLGGKSFFKGAIAAVLGIQLSMVGTDIFTGASRYTLGSLELLDGIDFIVATVGLFAIAEVLGNLESVAEHELFQAPSRLRDLMPTWDDIKRCRGAFVRSSFVGFGVGCLPGAGSTIASFIAYAVERAFSKHPEEFGKGAIEGVAAPEGANNSECGGTMVPLLTLGIPGSGTTAVLLAGLVLWGIRPGPLLFTEHPEIVWPLIASMYIGNVLLVIQNLPLVPLFASILRLPYYVLYTGIFGICILGVFSLDASMMDVWLTLGFGVLGYLMHKVGMPAAPVVLGLVLGTRMEGTFRQAMIYSHGSLSIFVTQPISAVLLAAAALLLLSPIVKRLRAGRAGGLPEPEAEVVQ